MPSFPVSLSEHEWKSRTAFLAGVMKNCVLCPRKCRVDRTAGEKGYCRLADKLIVSHVLPHHGEEPPVSGEHGAGTIFFSSCNLRCSFCQNHQISHQGAGKALDPSALADAMLLLQEKRCHNIEAVTPTPQLPMLLGALLDARLRGLRIPFVYNCSGYEDPGILKRLKGIVDIYMPDFKFGRADTAHFMSGAGDYPGYAILAIKEMIRQVGDSLVIHEGAAASGIVIRHLVLPGMLENSFEVMRQIRKRLSAAVPVSIMSQYTPIPAVMKTISAPLTACLILS